MKHIVLAMLALFSLPLVVTAGESGPEGIPSFFVSTDWLVKHLNDDDLVLLHAHWTNGGYRKAGHIPGARFLWLNSLSKDTPERSTEMPSAENARSVLKDLGITDRSKIIVYFEGQNLTMAARMILTFTYLGLGDRVSLLDGGIEAWKREGRPITKDIPAIKPGSFAPKLHPEVVADAEWVQKHLTDSGVTIIDARATRFYDGSSGPPSGGHIPHAVNIPFSSMVDSTNKILGPDALQQIFVKAGVKLGNQVVTYCHVGQQATLVYLAAKYIGYNARVYDGSFEDWSDRDLPVENPSQKK